MDRSTTETPWMFVMEETEDFNFTEIEPILASRAINIERMVADSVHFLLAVVSSLCVTITVIRTKSVRSQLLGVMLINLSVAVLIKGLIFTRHIEAEVRGRQNFGTLGCHLYYIGMAMSYYAANGSFVVICLDSTFSLPQSRVARMIGTFCTWVLAIIFSVIAIYGIDKGPEVIKHYRGHNICVAYHRSPIVIQRIFTELLYYIVPSVLVLVTLVRFCCTHRTNSSTKGKRIPFVLTAVMYLVLLWMARTSYEIAVRDLSNRRFDKLFFWSSSLNYYGRAVISLVWLVLIPDLRNKCLCRGRADQDSIELLE